MAVQSFSDASGSIAAGGVSQLLLAAATSRTYLFVQNTSPGDLWVNFTTAASAASPSQKIPSGASYSWPDGGAISLEQVNIFGASTGQTFTCKYD